MVFPSISLLVHETRITIKISVIFVNWALTGSSYALQTNVMYYKGIGHALATIARDEGFRGLYKGMGATLMVSLAGWPLLFELTELTAVDYASGFCSQGKVFVP